MREFFTEDVEFYHDRGGPTVGLAKLVGTLRDNLCGNPDSRLRREAVDGTVRIFPLKSEHAAYGAVLSGEHLFHVLDKGRPERADGRARFTHLWLLRDRAWRMARVLSYDHGPVPYVSKRSPTVLPERVLVRYVGGYRGPRSGAMVVQRGSGVLTLSIGGNTLTLYPESDGLFFSKERDLTFEFVKNDTGGVSKMVVRERGDVTEEAARLQ